MSRTNKGSKHPYAEYESKRNDGMFMTPGRVSKNITKRKERNRAKQETLNFLHGKYIEPEDY